MRYLGIIHMDESGAPAGGPSPELMARMGELMKEMTQAGVLLDTGGLKPNGTRLHLSGGKVTVLDGPYAEAKEVVGGYCFFQTKTQDEAVEWAKRFLLVHGDDWEFDVEIREVEQAPDFS